MESKKKLFVSHGHRLYLCQALLPQTPNAFTRVSPNAFTSVSPNAFAESATELASLACFCLLRSHVFFKQSELDFLFFKIHQHLNKNNQNGPRMDPEWTQEWTQNGPKMDPKWTQNGTKMDPKWTQNGP